MSTSTITLNMFAGETKSPRAVVTDNGAPVDLSSGYNVDLHVVRGDDPSALIIDKSTGLTGDDLVDVTSEGASGVAIASFVVADTEDLAPGDYLAQWRVEEVSTGAVKIQQFTLRVSRGLH